MKRNIKTCFAFILVDDIDVDGPGDIDSGNSTNHSPDDAQRNLLTTSTTEGNLNVFFKDFSYLKKLVVRL